MGILILLETAGQAAWLAHCDPDRTKYQSILAITPVAAYACQQWELPYLKLEDHTQAAKRFTEYASILPEYLEWEAWLDRWIQTCIPEFATSGFLPARNVTFLLQLLHAEIWSTTVSLHEFLDKAHPDGLALWQPKRISVPWFLHPLTSPVNILASSVARTRNLEVIDLNAQSPEHIPEMPASSAPRLGHRAARWLQRQIHQSAVSTEMTAFRAIGIIEYLKQLSAPAPHLLVSGRSQDLLVLARELRRRGARVTYTPDELPSIRLFSPKPPVIRESATSFTHLEDRIFAAPKIWEPMERWGLDRTPLWIEPLRFWWRHLVPELWLKFRQVQRMLSGHEYAALITWDAGGSMTGSASLNAAAIANVPRYLYQHGGSAHNDAKLWQMYLRQSDVFLVYGEGTADDLNRTKLPCLERAARVVPVGSSRLDTIRAQHNPEKSRQLRVQLQGVDHRPLILYIPSHFNGYGRAIGDLAAYPDVSYFELQQQILSLWLETPHVRLLYKQFAVANDLNRVMSHFIETHIPNGRVTDQSLIELMWAVDAIVLDHTITALGEVLLTNKPLVVYMPHPASTVSKASILLRKRAVVAETPLEFEAHVRALLHAGQYPEAENPNTEFLQAYCTDLNDCRSAERAAAVILQGIRRK